MIKVIHILFLICILPFLSCYQHIPEDKRACYKIVNEFAKGNWEFKESYGEKIIAEDSILFFTIIGKNEITDCILTLDKKEVKAIFDEPHKKDTLFDGRQTWFYYTFAGCIETEERKASLNCSYYLVRFNENNRCIDFGSGSSSRSH